jgi:hypothetical protein
MGLGEVKLTTLLGVFLIFIFLNLLDLMLLVVTLLYFGLFDVFALFFGSHHAPFFACLLKEVFAQRQVV